MQSLVGAGEGMLTTISEVVREGPCSSQEPCPHRAVCYLLFQFFSSVSTQHYHKVPDKGLWSFQPVAALWIQQNISDDSQLKEQPAQIFQFVEILVGIRHSEVKPFAWWGCNSHILLVAMPGPLATSWFFIVLCFLAMVFITASFGWALTTCQVLHMRLVATTILKRGHITLILKMKEPHSIRVSNLSVQLVSEKARTSVYRRDWRTYGLPTYFLSHYTPVWKRMILSLSEWPTYLITYLPSVYRGIFWNKNTEAQTPPEDILI